MKSSRLARPGIRRGIVSDLAKRLAHCRAASVSNRLETVEHEGYILIADITGYTVYLNESELEHAKGTLTDLLELLIEQTKPPL